MRNQVELERERARLERWSNFTMGLSVVLLIVSAVCSALSFLFGLGAP